MELIDRVSLLMCAPRTMSTQNPRREIMSQLAGLPSSRDELSREMSVSIKEDKQVHVGLQLFAQLHRCRSDNNLIQIVKELSGC